MSHELHYTSAPRGLKPGTHGFCTVAATANLAAPVAERPEGLSGYRPAFPPDHPSARLNPSVISHLKLNIIGQSFNILSRVGEAGLDYSGRGNKYAHHVALEASERPAGGPAWLASRRGFLEESWSGDPRALPKGRPAPQGDQAPTICRAWAQRFGDAGWAGVVAESFLADPNRPVYVFFEPGEDILPLFVEAIALLPRDRRWDVSFSTYYTGQAQGLTCLWRGVIRDSPEAEQAHRLPGVLIFDPANPMGSAKGGALVEQARTGIAPPHAPEPTARTAEARPPETARPTRPGSPRSPHAPIDYALLPDYAPEPAPAKGPIPRRRRSSKSTDRLDKVQIATWVGVAASLIFLVGAAVALYRSRTPTVIAQKGAELGNRTNIEHGSVEPETRPAASTGVGGDQLPLKTAASPSKPPSKPAGEKGMIESAVEKVAPEANGTNAQEVDRASHSKFPENTSEKPIGPRKRANTRIDGASRFRPFRPEGPPNLRFWDIQANDSRTLESKTAVTEVKLFPISPELNAEEKLEFKSENAGISILAKLGIGKPKTIATITHEPDNTFFLRKSEVGDNTTKLYSLLGNSILKVTFESGVTEYYLLQKPFAIPRTIVLSKHFTADFLRPQTVKSLFKEKQTAKLFNVYWDSCSLVPVKSNQEPSFGVKSHPLRVRTSIEDPITIQDIGKDRRQITIKVDNEVGDNSSDRYLSLDFDGWENVNRERPEEVRDLTRLFRSKKEGFVDPTSYVEPLRQSIYRITESMKSLKETETSAQNSIDLILKQMNPAFDDRPISHFEKVKSESQSRLKKLQSLHEDLKSIQSVLDIIMSYELRISLCIECAEGRFMIPLADEE